MILPFSGSRKQSNVKRMTLKRLVIELCDLCLVVKERRKENVEKRKNRIFAIICFDV
jgi:hypothetical protein